MKNGSVIFENLSVSSLSGNHLDKECAVAKSKKYIAQVWLIVTTVKKNNS